MKKIIFFILITANSFSQKKEIDTLKIFDYQKAFFQNNHSFKDFRGMKFPNVNTKDINGELFESVNSKRLVFYNFWQKNCTPCILEADMLNQLRTTFSNDVDFIGITYESKEEIVKFNTKHPFNFRQISIAQEKITNLFLYSGYPASFLVFDGEIIEVSTGGPGNKNSIYFYSMLYNTYSKFRIAIEKKLKEIKK